MSDQKQKQESECQCFGNSGLHASTYVPSWTDKECCDFCGLPIQEDSQDALTIINSP